MIPCINDQDLIVIDYCFVILIYTDDIIVILVIHSYTYTKDCIVNECMMS